MTNYNELIRGKHVIKNWGLGEDSKGLKCRFLHAEILT